MQSMEVWLPRAAIPTHLFPLAACASARNGSVCVALALRWVVWKPSYRDTSERALGVTWAAIRSPKSWALPHALVRRRWVPARAPREVPCRGFPHVRVLLGRDTTAVTASRLSIGSLG